VCAGATALARRSAVVAGPLRVSARARAGGRPHLLLPLPERRRVARRDAAGRAARPRRRRHRPGGRARARTAAAVRTLLGVLTCGVLWVLTWGTRSTHMWGCCGYSRGGALAAGAATRSWFRSHSRCSQTGRVVAKATTAEVGIAGLARADWSWGLRDGRTERKRGKEHHECRRAERRAGGRVECIKGVLGVLRVGFSEYSQSERPIPRGEPRWGVAPCCASGPLRCQRTLVVATPDRTICTTVASTRLKAPLRQGLKSGVFLVLRSARWCHRKHGVCSTPLLTGVTSILPGVAKPASV
jgi:hypothetical protein